MTQGPRPRPGEIVHDTVGGLWIAVEQPADHVVGEEYSPDVLLLPVPWEHRMLVAVDEGFTERRLADDQGRVLTVTSEAFTAAVARRATAQSRLGPRTPRATG